MTIRLQNLLVIPPIFLILGLAVGILADRAAQEEILWGLREEAVAVAVTVGEMTTGAAVDRLAAGDSLVKERILDALSRTARHGQVESIVVFSEAKADPVLSWHRDSTAASLEPELADRSRGLRSATVVDRVRRWGPYPAALVAAAPVASSSGGAEPRGSVAVVIDANRLASITRELRTDFALLALLVTAIGVASALFLSVSIGRQIRELGLVGARVAAGDYGVQIQVSGVKEVEDLSNTLGTMASILSDVLARGRQALLIGVPFQFTRSMAAAYKDARLREAPPPSGLEVGFSPIGKLPPGSFHGWRETPGQVVFWVGEVSPGEPLDLAIEAATANKALAHGLRQGTPEDAANSISELFHLSALQVACFPTATSDRPRALTVVGTGVPLMNRDYCVIHSFQAQHTETLTGSLSLVRDLSAAEAASQIPLALPQTFSGAILLVRRSRPSSGGSS